ncbi:MAG: hypothetical protein A2086_01225 [Spirochaetes bacterium GWD1_27_9]|nr:MAG: hypothetical protein A2Z98_00945 [Spirochaetes bacterium GWB1_27_13]OHD24055.1 MAG: hypothetical protein A2Y34_01145 [Spirochaetes bacterium GWC1_27_15]OHD42171.1 MAG: hypothetical protein A2086_01225 [Spirochaetes bacterium GWD1_27_9]
MIDLLINNVNNPFWSEIIKFYSYRYNITKIIESIIKNPTLQSLNIGYECLINRAFIDNNLKIELENIITKGIFSYNKDIAKISAEFRLYKRLEDMKKDNLKIFIDNSLITNAEYQLFIDDIIKKNYKPLHWKTNRFVKENINKPIFGISSKDALEFCNWLNTKYDKKIKYRLPLKEELNNFNNDRVKFWYKNTSNDYFIYGLNAIDIKNIKTYKKKE